MHERMLEWLVYCVLNVFEGTYNLLSNEQKVQKYINGAEDAIGYGSVQE